jgi:hypothetical protein
MSSYNAQRIADRRRAVAMLQKLQDGYNKRCAFDAADAMRSAKHDVMFALQADAEQIISEGVRMTFAHECWPAHARAA